MKKMWIKEYGIISWHSISTHVIHISCHMVKYSFSDSILESKNGWFAGSLIQHFWAHSGRIWARHLRDKWATRQVDQTNRGKNKKYAKRHLWISIPLIATNLAFFGTSTPSRSWTLHFGRKQMFHRRSIAKIGNSMRILRKLFQFSRNNLGNQERAKTWIDGILFPSSTLSYFPGC